MQGDLALDADAAVEALVAPMPPRVAPHALLRWPSCMGSETASPLLWGEVDHLALVDPPSQQAGSNRATRADSVR
eukprot:7109162-Pyramimonas_sp.AAC.1